FKRIAGTVIAAGMMIGVAHAKPADEFLVFNTIALHFENFDDRNALTPGIGWEYSPSSKIGWHLGTFSDSFGFQSAYAGLNYATKPTMNGRLRFILGATVLRKQYKANGGPETKLVPLPALELRLSRRSVLNVSGSPQVDFGDHHNNAVVFFQYKLNLN
ncbi:MAG: hypothetical protein AB8B63_02495, partial [Granulosicoccus sp.]